jgi:hypothetical protein
MENLRIKRELFGFYEVAAPFRTDMDHQEQWRIGGAVEREVEPLSICTKPFFLI